jgi:deglycase
MPGSVRKPLQPNFRMMDMSEQRLQGIRVAILATNGFEEAELLEPKKALEEAGARVLVVAPKAGSIYGMKHHDKAGDVKVDLALSSAKTEEFDAVMLPGGALNADALRVEKEAQKFVQEMDRSGKPVAFICHAPWLLVSAGLTRGRTLTSYHTIQDDIQNSGGNWVDREVVRDRNWVSSRMPDDIPAFNKEMLTLFGERKTRAQAS